MPDRLSDLLKDPNRQVSLDEWESAVFERHGVPDALRRAMMSQESGGDVNAVSPTGVRGRYQVTRSTAKAYGLDRDDPYQQALAAAKHLREQYDAARSSLKSDDEGWLAAVGRYYGGPSAVGADGSLSAKSPDGVSNPVAHVTKVAEKWGEFKRQGAQPASAQPARPAGPPTHFDLTGGPRPAPQPKPQLARPAGPPRLLPTAAERFTGADSVVNARRTTPTMEGLSAAAPATDAERRKATRLLEESEAYRRAGPGGKLKYNLKAGLAGAGQFYGNIAEKAAMLRPGSPEGIGAGLEIAGRVKGDESMQQAGRAVRESTPAGKFVASMRAKQEEAQAAAPSALAQAGRAVPQLAATLPAYAGGALVGGPLGVGLVSAAGEDSGDPLRMAGAALTGAAGVYASRAASPLINKAAGALSSRVAAPLARPGSQVVAGQPVRNIDAALRTDWAAEKALRAGGEAAVGGAANVAQGAGMSALTGQPYTLEQGILDAGLGAGASAVDAGFRKAPPPRAQKPAAQPAGADPAQGMPRGPDAQPAPNTAQTEGGLPPGVRAVQPGEPLGEGERILYHEGRAFAVDESVFVQDDAALKKTLRQAASASKPAKAAAREAREAEEAAAIKEMMLPGGVVTSPRTARPSPPRASDDRPGPESFLPEEPSRTIVLPDEPRFSSRPDPKGHPVAQTRRPAPQPATAPDQARPQTQEPRAQETAQPAGEAQPPVALPRLGGEGRIPRAVGRAGLRPLEQPAPPQAAQAPVSRTARDRRRLAELAAEPVKPAAQAQVREATTGQPVARQRGQATEQDYEDALDAFGRPQPTLRERQLGPEILRRKPGVIDRETTETGPHGYVSHSLFKGGADAFYASDEVRGALGLEAMPAYGEKGTPENKAYNAALQETRDALASRLGYSRSSDVEPADVRDWLAANNLSAFAARSYESGVEAAVRKGEEERADGRAEADAKQLDERATPEERQAAVTAESLAGDKEWGRLRAAVEGEKEPPKNAVPRFRKVSAERGLPERVVEEIIAEGQRRRGSAPKQAEPDAGARPVAGEPAAQGERSAEGQRAGVQEAKPEGVRQPLTREQLARAVQLSPIKGVSEFTRKAIDTWTFLLPRNEFTPQQLAEYVAKAYDLSDPKTHVDYSALVHAPADIKIVNRREGVQSRARRVPARHGKEPKPAEAAEQRPVAEAPPAAEPEVAISEPANKPANKPANAEARPAAKPKSAKTKKPQKRTTASDYLNEEVIIGGMKTTRGQFIQEMKEGGATQGEIEAYLMGFDSRRDASQPAPAEAKPQAAAPDDAAVVKAVTDIEPAAVTGALVPVADLRAKMGLPKAEFDKVMLDLARRYVVDLQRHDHPSSLPEAERANLVQDEFGNHFIGVALRDEGRKLAAEPPPADRLGVTDAELKAQNPELAAKLARMKQAAKPSEPRPAAERLDDLSQAARRRIRERGRGRLSSGIDPADLVDYSIVGAAKLAKGAVKFADWSAGMVHDFGEAVRPHLARIYRTAREVFADTKAITEFDSELMRAGGNTAKARSKPSVAMSLAVSKGLVKGRTLHQGAGRADNPDRALLDSTAETVHYDPNHTPGTEGALGKGDFDTVVTPFVANVLPPSIRRTLYRAGFDSLKPGGTYVVAVRGAADINAERKPTWQPYRDGYIVPNKGERNFQKGFTPDELAADLREAGFTDIEVASRGKVVMVAARKPQGSRVSARQRRREGGHLTLGAKGPKAAPEKQPLPADFDIGEWTERINRHVKEGGITGRKRARVNAAVSRAVAAHAAGDGAALVKAEKEAGDLISRYRKKTFGEHALDVAGLPKTWQTTLDFGYTFLQNGLALASHPRQAARAYRAGARALGADAHAEILAKQRNHPHRRLARLAGLELGGLARLNDSMTKYSKAGSDLYSSSLAERIPGVGRVVRAFDRSMAASVDTLRLSMFENIVKDLQKQGKTWAKNADEFRQAAAVINHATGYVNFGKAGEKGAAAAGLFIRAPRWTASRFMVGADVAKALFSPKMSHTVRKAVLRDLAVNAMVISTLSAGLVYGLKAAGVDAQVSFDPDDDDFLKVKVGNERYTLTPGGVQPTLRLAAKVGKNLFEIESFGETELREFVNDSFGDVMKWTRGKLSPVAGAAYDLTPALSKGRTITGDEATLGRVAANLVTPIGPKNVAEAMRDGGYKKPASYLRAAAEFHGLGAADYAERSQTPAGAPKLLQEFDKQNLRWGGIVKKSGEPQGVFDERARRFRQWSEQYGDSLVNHFDYKSAKPEVKKKALDIFAHRLQLNSNLKQPNVQSLSAAAVVRAARESLQAKPKRDMKYLYAAPPE